MNGSDALRARSPRRFEAAEASMNDYLSRGVPSDALVQRLLSAEVDADSTHLQLAPQLGQQLQLNTVETAIEKRRSKRASKRRTRRYSAWWVLNPGIILAILAGGAAAYPVGNLAKSAPKDLERLV